MTIASALVSAFPSIAAATRSRAASSGAATSCSACRHGDSRQASRALIVPRFAGQGTSHEDHHGVRASRVTGGDVEACLCAITRAASACWARARRITASCRWALRRDRLCRLKRLLMCDTLTPQVVVCRSPYSDRAARRTTSSATPSRSNAYAVHATGHSSLHLPVLAGPVTRPDGTEQSATDAARDRRHRGGSPPVSNCPLPLHSGGAKPAGCAVIKLSALRPATLSGERSLQCSGRASLSAG